VFLQDINWKTFNIYLSFENYRRQKECPIDEYLSEFDLRYYKLSQCEVTLPDAVIACRLLKSCDLSDVHFQLALTTTTKMTFENMRSTLKKLFAESSHLLTGVSPKTCALKIEENAFEADVYLSNSTRPRNWRRNNNGASNYSGNYNAATYSGASSRNRKMNPLKPDGTVSVCAICGSRMHWARNCPHSHEHSERQSSVYYNYDESDEQGDEEVQVTLLAEDSQLESKMNWLLGESIGSVLLDSGCSKTVCGKQWLKCFVDTLNIEQRHSIVYQPSSSIYRFGDGKRMKSQNVVDFPCMLAGKNIRVKSDVVDCNIPLLLSKASMKRAGMVLDLQRDCAQVFGKTVKLNTTTMGHYIMPICPSPSPELVESVLSIFNVPANNKYVAIKLHKQFAHPSFEKLKKVAFRCW
jgi:hypothetical protein